MSMRRGRYARGNSSSRGRSNRVSRSRLQSASQIERWLNEQDTIPTTHLISYLSSEEGLHALTQIVDNRSLSSGVVVKLAKLVTRDGIRSSLQKHDTNKIYGAFLGSAFLTRIQGYLEEAVQPRPEDVWPFVYLFQEMQSRTTDGWRFVSVEAVREAIEGIPQGPEKEELYQQFLKLSEHRNKLKRLQLLAKSKVPDTSEEHECFRELAIIPSEKEISCHRPEKIPVNRVRENYCSVNEYLSIQFQLLREDCIASLRRAIQGLRKNVVPSDIKRYTQVKFFRIHCGNDGVDHCISFRVPKNKPIDWSLSNRLMVGSLVCISCDGFRSYIWGIVKERDARETAALHLIPGNESSKFVHVEFSKSFEMIESSAAYFEPYHHVLKCLQRPEMEEFPFSEHFLSLQPQVSEPAYLKQKQVKDAYDFECAFPEMKSCLGRGTVRILGEWPQWSSSLDESQMQAVKQGLTKRLAIIQGPPGTGKTYVGLKIATILLSNVRRGPILVICYTNHALDQFLESIYAVEDNIVRIGGRSTNEIMKNRSLNELSPRGANISRPLRVRHAQLSETKTELQETIQRCIMRMRARHISKYYLGGVASQKHIQSLYSRSPTIYESVEEEWLEEGQPPVAQHGTYQSKGKQKDLISTSNTFSALDQDNLAGESKADQPAESSGHKSVDKVSCDYPIADEVKPADPQSTEISLDEILGCQDLWLLEKKARKRLHKYWLDRIRENAEQELERLSRKYKFVCDKLHQSKNALQLQTLREAKVVGMTTAGAAKNYNILQALRAEIVVIEEAAEVLEAHILPCIGSFTEHLILLGDHLQLRPSVAEYELATKHKLEISLFERLINGGVEHVTLRCQRRMRPSISALISDLYPSLQDHGSVKKYEDVKGIKNNVFFLDHKGMESETIDASSKVNVKEARLIVEFCLYLTRQGYENSDITILTMYKGQMSEIQKNLKDRILSRSETERMDVETLQTPRVCSVDNYQGEECKIILLSLVRSNKMIGVGGSKGRIGFLKVSNRVCVALSRAKMGLYIFGNAELLASKSSLWESIIQKLGRSNSIGPALSLACQNHPQTGTNVSAAEDFRQVEDGGCSRPCESQLKCGHACPRRCHPCDHDKIICPKPCPKKFEDSCGHQCTVICHFSEECPPCKVLVPKVLPACGHPIVLPCSALLEDALCNERCPVQFDCGHQCPSKCGRPCKPCKIKVAKNLPCGHTATLPCCDNPATFSCIEPCQKVLSPGCEHLCKGTCGSCKQGTSHIPCKEVCSRDLPCGHRCVAGCSEICPPCRHPCEKRCLHCRCTLHCGALCIPCMEKCECRCQHYNCNLLCHQICSRPRCNQPCQETLSCGHPCIGLCGESCPKLCRVCHPNHVDIISQMTLEEYDSSERFVELIDCGHVFEVSGLDTWMDMDDNVLEAEPGAVAVKLKQCPECRSPIRRSLRYSNIVKVRLQQIEEVKERILGFERLKKGNRMLKAKNYDEAIKEFNATFEFNPWSLEAHLGMGRALCGLKNYEQATEHLCFIIEGTSYKALILEKAPELSWKCSFRANILSNPPIAENELAIDAMLQWASLCYFGRISSATGLAICDVILNKNPRHARTLKLKKKLESGVVIQEVVEVMTREVGGRGHWYKCPNGHYYVVGECGGPMQKSKCPDCKAVVGGESHAPAEGNSHADIDGSSHPAWSNATGLVLPG